MRAHLNVVNGFECVSEAESNAVGAVLYMASLNWQVSGHDLSLIPMGLDSWLKVDSSFHTSKVSILGTQLAGWGETMCSLHN